MIDSELLLNSLIADGFHIIDNFLEPVACQSLRKIAQESYNKKLFRSAKIGLNLETHKNNTIRTDEIFWMDEQENEPSIKSFLGQIRQLAQIINQSLFLGLNEFENHFAIYQSGSFYKKHIDQFATKKTRKISCVYYLNKDWDAAFGGELKIYDKNDQLIQDILPQENRFICFNSELPHEVCVTHQTRYSIAGWLKTRSRNNMDIVYNDNLIFT